MNRYKVLPLEPWMKYAGKKLVGLHHSYMTPVFKRNGYYYDRLTGTVWHEIGKYAIKHRRKDDFLYCLSLLDLRPWSQRDWQAWNYLITSKARLTKAQKAEWHLQIQSLQLKDIRRNSALARKALLA